MDRVPDLRLRRYPSWIWYALGVYAISFLLPTTLRGHGQGWIFFVAGVFFMHVPFCWPWVANPFFWLACGLSRYSKLTAFVLACLALFSSCSFAFLILDKRDAGHYFGPAYWCWTASMAIAVVCSGLDLMPARTRAAVVPLLEYDEPAVSSIPRDPGIQK